MPQTTPKIPPKTALDGIFDVVGKDAGDYEEITLGTMKNFFKDMLVFDYKADSKGGGVIEMATEPNETIKQPSIGARIKVSPDGQIEVFKIKGTSIDPRNMGELKPEGAGKKITEPVRLTGALYDILGPATRPLSKLRGRLALGPIFRERLARYLMLADFKAFLDELEPNLSSEFEDEELEEYLKMSKDEFRERGLHHGPKRTFIKASSYAVVALGMNYVGRGMSSKKAHYYKMKEDLDQQFDQQVGKSPRRMNITTLHARAVRMAMTRIAKGQNDSHAFSNGFNIMRKWQGEQTGRKPSGDEAYSGGFNIMQKWQKGQVEKQKRDR